MIDNVENANVCSIENEDGNVVSKGSCESVIPNVELVITNDAVESGRKPVTSVFIDNPDGSVEIYDDVDSTEIEFNIVDSVSKFETVCAVESDTTDGAFDNEAVSFVDNSTSVSNTDCDKVKSTKDDVVVDIENDTDAVNSLTNIDSVDIADVVDSAKIDADCSKSDANCNDDVNWRQAAALSAQNPASQKCPPSGQ